MSPKTRKRKNIIQAIAILIFGIVLVVADFRGWEVWSPSSIIHQPIPTPILAILGIIFISAGFIVIIRTLCGKEP